MIRRMVRVTATLGALSLLAGCGTDLAAREGTAALRALGASALSTFRGGGATQTAAPPQFERATLDAVGAPLRIVTLQTGATAGIVEIRRDGALSVMQTTDGIQFAFRDGVMAATRGLGVDLMAATTPPAAALRRPGGTHGRTYEWITGTNATARVAVQCTVAPAGSETLSLYGITVATTAMAETCTGPGVTIENRYWFDSRGRIRQSREWANPRLRYIDTTDPAR